MTEPSCAHLDIRYAPKSLQNHSYQERWMCSDCDSEFLPKSRFDKVRVEAHTAGANEMVERCVAAMCGFCEDAIELFSQNGQWLHDFGGGNRADVRKCLATPIRSLSSDPNYLQGKIEASTKELREALKSVIEHSDISRAEEGFCTLCHEDYDCSKSDCPAEMARQALKETDVN